jgi:hypothetical protein
LLPSRQLGVTGFTAVTLALLRILQIAPIKKGLSQTTIGYGPAADDGSAVIASMWLYRLGGMMRIPTMLGDFFQRILATKKQYAILSSNGRRVHATEY